MSAGARFLKLVKEQPPLQVVGVINPYCALLAQRAGFKALYLSGAGVANSSLGLPDLAVTTLNDVATDAGRITSVTNLPLLVDIDTGWGNSLMVRRTIETLQRLNVAAVHIEDQIEAKRCGHRPNKQLVSIEQMCARISAACEGKGEGDLVIMARTDAFAQEGFDGMIDRALAYKRAGAQMLFAEALTNLDDYRRLKQQIEMPVLANLTEFGKTPLFSIEELQAASIDIALYPLSASRAMYRAAEQVYQAILDQGTSKGCLAQMQTREELYDVLGYHQLEKLMDAEVGQ